MPELPAARAPWVRRVGGHLFTSIVAGSFVALAFFAADTLARRAFERDGLAPHFGAGIGLCLGAGALFGTVAWLGGSLALLGSLAFEKRSPLAAARVRAALLAAFVSALAAPGVFSLFAGRMVRRGPLGTLGPYAALVFLGSTVFLAGLVSVRLLDRAKGGGSRARAGWWVVFVAIVSVVLLAVDLHVFVALYERLHALLELLAGLSLFAATAMWLTLFRPKRAVLRYALATVGLCASGWALGIASSPALRDWIEESLRAAERDPVYLGRILHRIDRVERRLQAGKDGRGLSQARVDELVERYDVTTVSRDLRWDAAPAPVRPVKTRTGGSSGLGYNVLVYYVDTLRSDVAFDREVMPHVARFAEGNVKFDRAYSTGSDTLRALPSLLRGSYDVDRQGPRGLLDAARAKGIATTLFIGDSAFEFLAKLVPEFAFDDVFHLPDYNEGGVWGYGASGPTAGHIVDRALEWLSERPAEQKDRPFFAWLFNFDVHNWRELDSAYVDNAAERYHVPEEGRWNWRYRVVARSVDAEFGRLMDGLSQMGLYDRTIVLFVSDHGEGLGYQDFWVHSIFLWEPLVRVPLILHVPGTRAEVVSDEVSLVDVAPTLTRCLGLDPWTGTHGEDLLGLLGAEKPRRRLPLLLVSAAEGQLARVGIIRDGWKLVLPLDWGDAELYDLSVRDPDDVDVAEGRPHDTAQLMSELMRSPVFSAARQELSTREGSAR